MPRMGPYPVGKGDFSITGGKNSGKGTKGDFSIKGGKNSGKGDGGDFSIKGGKNKNSGKGGWPGDEGDFSMKGGKNSGEEGDPPLPTGKVGKDKGLSLETRIDLLQVMIRARDLRIDELETENESLKACLKHVRRYIDSLLEDILEDSD